MDRICFMWRSATLPVSFCANRVMVLGCTVRSRRISRSRLYSPYTEPENEPCHAECQTGTNPNRHPKRLRERSAFHGKVMHRSSCSVVSRADAVDFPRGTNPIQRKAYTGIFRYGGKVAGVFFVCHQFGTKLFTRGQFAGNACLHSKQQTSCSLERP